MSLTIIFSFIFGTIIGSFLNVVSLRYNTGGIADGRSKCFSCGKELRWYELVPVFSYILIRGRCLRCKSSVSFQYPIIEILTGLIFALILYKHWPVVSLVSSLDLLIILAIFSAFIVIAIYDSKHKIIPDGLAYILSFLALFRAFLLFEITGIKAFVIILTAGPLVALPIFLLWFVSKGRWIGFGDVKLSLAIGWLLGPILGLSAIIVGFWVGAIFGVTLILLSKFHLFQNQKMITMKSEIPFGPFLIIGTLFIYLFPFDVLNLSILISLL